MFCAIVILPMLCPSMRVMLLQVVIPFKCLHGYRRRKLSRLCVASLLVESSCWDDDRVMSNNLGDYFSSVFATDDFLSQRM